MTVWVICCVDSPTFGILVPSRNGTWIGAYALTSGLDANSLDRVSGEPFQILITNIYGCQTLLGGKVLNLTDARSLSVHQVQIGRVFTLLVVSTYILNGFI